MQNAVAFTDIKAVHTYDRLPEAIKSSMIEHHVDAEDISIIVQKVAKKGHTKDKNTALISHLATRKRFPASTLKLFTTFSALETLGKDFQWQTKVFHTGTINNGILNGDLIIKGGADPKFVKEHIIELFEKVKAQGIHTIDGDMLLDSSIFRLPIHDPSAFDNKPLRPYNAGASGLLVNFSALILHFTPKPKENIAELTFEPVIADTFLPETVELAKDTPCKQWRNTLEASFVDNHLNFAGKYQEGCNFGTWPIAHPDPEHFAKGVLKGNWLALDGELTGQVKYSKLPKNVKLIATQDSPNLASVIKDINQYSNNVMTEQVYLSLPVFSKNNDSFSSYKKAKKWFQTWWQQRFYKTKLAPPNITKASGLCHDCAIRPMTLHALLHYAAQHPDFDTFKDSLSVAGETGTVRNFRYRIPDSPAIGNAYLKTGTLDDVSSIAGYVDARSGQTYSVTAIINKTDASLAKPVLDNLIDWVAKQ